MEYVEKENLFDYCKRTGRMNMKTTYRIARTYLVKIRDNCILVHLEKIGIFPKGLVAVIIYDTNVPLIRWVHKPKFLKILDFIIFKFKIDLIYEYFIKVFKLKYYIFYFKKFTSSIHK